MYFFTRWICNKDIENERVSSLEIRTLVVEREKHKYGQFAFASVYFRFNTCVYQLFGIFHGGLFETSYTG